jgi:hypothetical protein
MGGIENRPPPAFCREQPAIANNRTGVNTNPNQPVLLFNPPVENLPAVM